MVVKRYKNQGVEPRVVAASILNEVLQEGKTLDDALSYAKHLPEIDKKLVHAICGYVFRRLPEIDRVIDRVTRKKSPVKPSILHNLLRVGIAQLLYMDIPPHAALNTTVSAAVPLKLFRQKAFVNGVLRTVQRDQDVLLSPRMTALECLPEWLRTSWVKAYGENDASQMADTISYQAPLDITFASPQVKDEYGQDLGGETILPWSMRIRERTSHVMSWPGFDTGAWWVQDVASSIPINMLGDITGKTALDIGAAPGGKTLQLVTKGAKVTALDDSASRTTRLRDNLRRVVPNQKVNVVVADARSWQTTDAFDVVVIDAPCSSTGTLRRHPELPWIRSQKQVMDLVVTQREIMDHAADLLSVNGVMLYCTCSLQPEEGEKQVEVFLQKHKNFKMLINIPEVLSPYVRKGLGDVGFRTFPHDMVDKGGMDGFFFCLMQKQ